MKRHKSQATLDAFVVRSPKVSPASSPTKKEPGMRQATLESLKVTNANLLCIIPIRHLPSYQVVFLIALLSFDDALPSVTKRVSCSCLFCIKVIMCYCRVW